MDKKEYKYDAFISYRHCDLDKFVAENLHKTLENYDLPKNVKEKLGITGKTIKRVFRDQDELPLSSNLEDPIIDALNNSKYLIVICSPRLKDSLWCKKEIETFKKLRGRKNIFCVLVEGEPSDSFPEEVLYDEDEKGKRILVEPLAADVRGTTKKEIKKKIEEEKLRLIASMLNIDYDDLKQRHKQREQRRKMMIVTAIASFLLIFSLYTSIMLIKINSQAKTLKEHQALSLASDSERYLQNDNRYDAIKTSYEALTKFNKVKMPYTPEAEYALEEAIGVYDVGFSYKSIDELKTKGVVDYIKGSNDNKYASTYDESETLTLFDTKTLKIIKEYNVGNVFYEESFAFIGNDKLAFINDKGNLVIVNNKDGKVINEIKKEDNRYIAVNSNYEGDKIAFNDGNNITIYDVKNNKEITKFSTDEKFDKKMYFKKDSNYLFAFTHPTKILSYDDENIKAHVYDTNELKEINSISFDVGYIDNISTKDDNAYLLFSSNTSNGVVTLVVSYNYKTGNTNWTRTYDGKWGKFITRSFPEGSSSIVVTTRNNIYVLDEATGNTKQEFSVEDEIINIYSFVDEELYLAFLANGSVNYVSMKMKEVVEYKDKFIFNVDSYKMVTQSSNGFIMVPYNDNRVILYEEKSNKNVKKEDIKLDYIKDHSVKLTEEKKIKEEYKINNINLVEKYIYSDKKDILFINYTNGDIAIYNTKDKILIKTLENVGSIDHYFGKDKYGRTYVGNITDSYILDKDYNKVGHIIGLCKLEKDKVYILHNGKYYSLKIYTLDDLLKEAREYLK
jgi:hypothetical protein